MTLTVLYSSCVINTRGFSRFSTSHSEVDLNLGNAQPRRNFSQGQVSLLSMSIKAIRRRCRCDERLVMDDKSPFAFQQLSASLVRNSANYAARTLLDFICCNEQSPIVLIIDLNCTMSSQMTVKLIHPLQLEAYQLV